jgi:putative flippase GtrA
MPGIATPSRQAALRKLIKYGSVSAISTATSLTILGVLVGIFSFPAIWANVIATAIATVPSFELNRRWVWAQRGQRSLLRQATPYFLLSLSGLVISTFAVHLASDATSATSRLLHTAAVEMANVAAYGTLWIIQFALCDRVLFRTPEAAPDFDDRNDRSGKVPGLAPRVPDPGVSGTNVTAPIRGAARASVGAHGESSRRRARVGTEMATPAPRHTGEPFSTGTADPGRTVWQ